MTRSLLFALSTIFLVATVFASTTANYFFVAAQTTSTSIATTSTTLDSNTSSTTVVTSTTVATTAVATTLAASSTTVTAPVTPERSSQRYFLRLSGNTAWRTLLQTKLTQLRNSIQRDLAARFHTTFNFITILNLTYSSLNVDFSVAPSGDGTQIRESTFLGSSSNSGDTSWLSDTGNLYSTVSSSGFSVLSSRYENVNQTMPPKNVVCADGCVGAVAGTGVALFVLLVFGVWAWRRHTKDQDEQELENLGVSKQHQQQQEGGGQEMRVASNVAPTSIMSSPQQQQAHLQQRGVSPVMRSVQRSSSQVMGTPTAMSNSSSVPRTNAFGLTANNSGMFSDARPRGRNTSPRNLSRF